VSREEIGSRLRGSLQSAAAGDVDQLRQATREAREAAAGLREAIRDSTRERQAVRQMLAGIEGHVRRVVGERIEAEVARQVADLAIVTEKAMREAVAKVEREFDRLARIFTGRERPDTVPLEDLARRYVASHEDPAKRPTADGGQPT
jgi:hypothetical protein